MAKPYRRLADMVLDNNVKILTVFAHDLRGHFGKRCIEGADERWHKQMEDFVG
jgi:hypothetical protein